MSKADSQYKRKNRKNQAVNCYDVGAPARETVQNVTENSTVLNDFKRYADILDARRDKFERLYKISRDITIESKRIIFLLHTIDRESKREKVLSEAEARINSLISQNWKAITTELDGENYYFYHKAFTFGMQEFLEAFIFFNYLKNSDIYDWDHYQNKLKYSILDTPVGNKLSKISSGDEADFQDILPKEISLLIDANDFICGLADVTGELMRKCTNNLGEGDVSGCFDTCTFAKGLYIGFLSLFGMNMARDMNRKKIVLKQNVLKMEMICYNIQVRGTESLKYCLGDVESQEVYVDDCCPDFD